MNDVRIRFSSDILRRLGEELNPSVDKGILELVKNSYDADARHCRIELTSTEEAGGSITVSDDGDGMAVKDIETGWLVLGRSIKRKDKLTRLGRIPAGSKGLGRLASLRMGSRALLTTRPRKEKQAEYGLLIDWDDFDNVDLIDDVALTIESSKRKPGNKSGTVVRIENLRLSISRMDVKRLARELLLLADPFGDDPASFTPVLVSKEFRDLEKLVQNRYFQDAEYHLHASVSKSGQAEAKVTDWKGNALFTATHGDIAKSRSGEPYLCPPMSFDLWVFILNQTTFSTRNSTLGEVREWLQEFGGVHLYHNALRVAPYGNQGNDWLELNLQRVRSPEERPGTNTSIGRIDIADPKEMLIQKTDRSGFIEGESFKELTAFAKDAMDWMANRRLDQAEKRRAKERKAAPKVTSRARQRVEAAIASAPKKTKDQFQEAFDAYDNSRQREVSQLHKEVQLYRTLSTAGITAATFAHESSGNPVKVIDQSIGAVERRAKKALGEKYKNTLEKPVSSIMRAIKSIGVLGKATLKLLDHDKRRLSHVDLHDVVGNVVKTFTPFLEGRGVTPDLSLCNGDPYIQGSEAAVESIVTNLINNSVSAFENANVHKRCLRITTTINEDIWVLRIADNGPGIQGISSRDIWLPGRTTRKNGTGLGLTIVKDAVQDLGGNARVEEHGELGGAEVTIEIPLLGV
jgi:signal transduction histidine kinase